MEPVRRLFDIFAGLLGLALLSPVFLVIAVWIKLDSPGSVFFFQPRVGMGGNQFILCKFRTMFDRRYTQPPQISPPQTAAEMKFREDYCCDICARPVAECTCVTRAGRLLRASGLDELPQLWNVVVGDMTFVGPRPALPRQVQTYSPEQRRRLAVKPGITGWAQLFGRNSISWDKKIEMDLWYIEHQTLWLDCKIGLQTVVGLWRGEI
jgi:undecaprenyl phosphate N,N'-diacetylbacillosamine 1-phosphate transferase